MAYSPRLPETVALRESSPFSDLPEAMPPRAEESIPGLQVAYGTDPQLVYGTEALEVVTSRDSWQLLAQKQKRPRPDEIDGLLPWWRRRRSQEKMACGVIGVLLVVAIVVAVILGRGV